MFLTCMRWLWLRRVSLSFFSFRMGGYDRHLWAQNVFIAGYGYGATGLLSVMVFSNVVQMLPL
jgi:hypothetical protein